MSGSHTVTCVVMLHTDVQLTTHRPQSVNDGDDDGADGSCVGCDDECTVWWTVVHGPDLRMECRIGFSIGLNNNDRARNLHTSQLPHDHCDAETTQKRRGRKKIVENCITTHMNKNRRSYLIIK